MKLLFELRENISLHAAEISSMLHLYNAQQGCYIRRGGHVFIGVCLFVSGITQKQLGRFSQNWLERWHLGLGKKPLDFCDSLSRNTVRLG